MSIIASIYFVKSENTQDSISNPSRKLKNFRLFQSRWYPRLSGTRRGEKKKLFSLFQLRMQKNVCVDRNTNMLQIGSGNNKHESLLPNTNCYERQRQEQSIRHWQQLDEEGEWVPHLSQARPLVPTPVSARGAHRRKGGREKERRGRREAGSLLCGTSTLPQHCLMRLQTSLMSSAVRGVNCGGEGQNFHHPNVPSELASH